MADTAVATIVRREHPLIFRLFWHRIAAVQLGRPVATRSRYYPTKGTSFLF